LLACLAGLFLYLCLFSSLEAKKKILRSSLGGEREMCVFQWLFITILIQTRLINQFTTFYFFFYTMHSRYCQDLSSVHLAGNRWKEYVYVLF
jgi:hypothetical protein